MLLIIKIIPNQSERDTKSYFNVLQVFCAELPVFLREHRSRLYRTDAYFLGKSLAEFPLFMLVPLIFTSIAYPMIGLRPTFVNFAIAIGIVVLVANVATSFGESDMNLRLNDNFIDTFVVK